VAPRRGGRLTPRSAHLQVGRGFSYGCGVALAEELIEAAGETGMSSLALTDKDGLYGIPRLLKAGRRGRRVG
jgi:error-prone DNA polymerase